MTVDIDSAQAFNQFVTDAREASDLPGRQRPSRRVERTRAKIVESAAALFHDEGYDPTSMERIARQAGVSPSTLYRHFPNKELVLADPLLRIADFGSLLDARPADEFLGHSLGEILRSAYPGRELSAASIARLARTLSESRQKPSVIAFAFGRAVEELEASIAQRLGMDRHDVVVKMSTRVTFTAFARALRDGEAVSDADSWAAKVDDVLRQLSGTRQMLPQ